MKNKSLVKNDVKNIFISLRIFVKKFIETNSKEYTNKFTLILIHFFLLFIIIIIIICFKNI